MLTAKCETSPINENAYTLLTRDQAIDDEHWVEKTFTVGSELAGKDLALIALHFENANNINMYLGECSIVRGTARTPETPTITSSKLLAFSKSGVDGSSSSIWQIQRLVTNLATTLMFMCHYLSCGHNKKVKQTQP